MTEQFLVLLETAGREGASAMLGALPGVELSGLQEAVL